MTDEKLEAATADAARDDLAPVSNVKCVAHIVRLARRGREGKVIDARLRQSPATLPVRIHERCQMAVGVLEGRPVRRMEQFFAPEVALGLEGVPHTRGVPRQGVRARTDTLLRTRRHGQPKLRRFRSPYHEPTGAEGRQRAPSCRGRPDGCLLPRRCDSQQN